jgi:hypothetical protein
VKQEQALTRPLPWSKRRAFRGLVLTFSLSFLNLLGVALVVTALSGLGDWSRWQFVAFFGMVEAAWGLSNILGPNIWRLPVAQVATSPRTSVKLAASTLLIPHWAGAGRVAGGLTLIAAAASQEGATAGVVLAPVESVLIAVGILATSALAARFGVARPEVDVLQLVVRWRARETEVPAFSLSASVLQLLLSIVPIPFVKLFEPTAVFSGGVGVRAETLLVTAGLSVVFVVFSLAAWRGHISWSAPAEQETEAEENA